jgi:hypothetical protein
MLNYNGKILRTVVYITNTYTRKFDYVEPYSYCGITTSGNTESAETWTIYRIETALNGTVTTTTATSVAWIDRLTAIYS